MKEDAVAVIDEATEVARISLDGLDRGVKAFENGVGERMDVVAQQAELMGFDCRARITNQAFRAMNSAT
jgi:hypothetical protein